MKASGLYIALQLTPLALAAPVALPQILRLEPGPLDPPHTGTSPGRRWKFGHPKTAPEVITFGVGNKDGHFDNRPLSPSSSFSPSKALEHHRPLSTELLLALGLADKTSVTEGSRHHGGSDEYSAQHRLDMEDSIEISELDIAIAIPTASRLGTPCQYARLSRERNDVLVVLLAVAFLLVVLVMESWESICQSVSRTLGWQGAIRLEDEVEERDGPLSIRAFPEDEFEDAEDEKADVRIDAEPLAVAR